jgi:hypothetical protein
MSAAASPSPSLPPPAQNSIKQSRVGCLPLTETQGTSDVVGMAVAVTVVGKEVGSCPGVGWPKVCAPDPHRRSKC